jgi:hypothetical protein
MGYQEEEITEGKKPRTTQGKSQDRVTNEGRVPEPCCR